MTTYGAGSQMRAEDVLEALNRRLQALEATNEELKSQLQTATLVDKNLEPKLALPEKFYGNEENYKGFMIQLESVFTAAPRRYALDSAKIAVAASLLTGRALNWYAPLKGHQEQHPEMFSSWEGFKKIMASQFSPLEATRISEDALSRLKQGGGPVATYASKFQGLLVDVQWNEPALIHHFRRGLTTEVKDMMALGPDATTLSEAIAQAIRCDRRCQERRFESPRYQPTRGAGGTDGGGVRDMDLDAIGVNRLSRAVIRDYMRSGKCFSCGQQGHVKANCPSASKKD